MLAEGPHLILFPSWVQVLERVLDMPDPAWNWALAGLCCEFRLMSTLLSTQCLARHSWQWAELLVLLGFGVVWVQFIPIAADLCPGVQKTPGA